jgi:hypothetical protein
MSLSAPRFALRPKERHEEGRDRAPTVEAVELPSWA